MGLVKEKLYGTVMDSPITEQSPKTGRDHKRDAILDVAHAAFLADGYAATSMSSIAAKVGGSKATLYNYFSSKEELFAAVIQEKCHALQLRLFADGFDTDHIEAALTRLGERFLELVLTDEKTATYRMVAAEAGRFPELGNAFFYSGPGAGVRHIGEYFERAIASGQLCAADSTLMAEQFLDLCKTGLYQQRILNIASVTDDAAIKANVANAVYVFLCAYGTGERPSPPWG
jgi:AcrR family transcriptional regulator